MNKAIVIAAAALCIGFAASAQAQDAGQSRTFTDADGFEARETPGGYEPANPPLPTNLQPGTRIQFVAQTLTPSQAFPPPPALRVYPVCTPKRRDNCRQR